MTHLLTILFLLLACVAQGAGLGPYNPAQHSVNGFMPTQVPDLQLWLDASKLSWVTNGQSVEVWRDWSGKSNAATNGTASKQPVISTINGRNGISFDGIDDYVSINNFVSDTFFNFYVVAYDRKTGGNLTMIAEHGTNNNNQDGFYVIGWGNPWSVRRTTQHYSFGAERWLFTNSQCVASVSYNGNASVKRNNKDIPYSLTLVGTSITNRSSVTNTLFIGCRNGAQFFSDMILCELILYTNKLHSSLDDKLQRYLGTKYGIVVK